MSAPAATALPAGIAIDAHGVEKRYGGTLALKGVDVVLEAGRIHALVGENGAGKSTFLGVIAGRVVPSAGSVSVLGAPHVFGALRQARRLGIAAIYQELTIVPALTARANVFLGQPFSRGGLLSERAMEARYGELCARLGVIIPGHLPAGRLSIADQQMLEIMRGVQSDARLLLFDEPTTALAPPERDALFRVMRQLRDSGKTMMFVSHNLEEVLGLADTVTVFRDGQVVAAAPCADWDKASLVRAMIGHDIAPARARARRARPVGEAPFLAARGVSLAGALSDISLEVRPGEVLGVGGLVGSGRTSLLRCLAGLEPQSSGELTIAGEAVPWPRTPRQALRAGIALVPEDRKHQGLVLGLSAIENVALTNYRKVSHYGVVSKRMMQARIDGVVREFGFAVDRLGATVRNLSGGNQQKILLSKWHYERPKLLMVDEPTRGIDVGAKEEILATLRRLADDGLSIIVVSSELEEVVAISDRVIVLSEGRHVASLGGEGELVTVDGILHAAFKTESQ
ncbi:MAG: sugar ABC transporter ATP-binding protein [Rhizobiales bacterium]|nr:sugar ABC transporter ATP-binding protein [Hyphomicrobiales bacterium]